MTQPTLPGEDRPTVRADQLKPGDWVAGLLDGDPWRTTNGRVDAEVLSVHPFVDAVDNPRVLVVAKALTGGVPEGPRLLAAEPVRLLTDAERDAVASAAERAQRIADLRKFADWLEDNPWVPFDSGLNGQWIPPTPFRADGVLNSGPDGLAQVRELAGRMGVELVERDDRTWVVKRFGDGAEYHWIAWHQGGRPAEVAPVDDLGFGYSREQDDPTPVSPARGGPLHVGGVVAGGVLVDETVAEVSAAAVHFSEAYREAARKASPERRSSPTLRTAAALDLLHGQALAEDAERARRADVREGEQGRVTSVNVARFFAQKEDEARSRPVDWHECDDPERCDRGSGHQAPELTVPALPIGESR